MYPSEWAANSAIYDYHALPEKIEIIPFGVNLDDSPSLEQVFPNKRASPCRLRLLFVGRDWSRKGGDIAFQTLISLCDQGIDAELTMVGSVLPVNVQHDKLKVISYLNKNSIRERKLLDEIFLKASLFIFPTLADCSPLVIGEANAFDFLCLPQMLEEYQQLLKMVKMVICCLSQLQGMITLI